MSFGNQSKISVLAFYLSQIGTAVLGLLVPVLLLRAEGRSFFGFVAFVNAVQAWFQLSDWGLTSAMTRNCSMCTQKADLIPQAALLRKAETLLFSSSLACGLLVTFLIVKIYPDWLDPSAAEGNALQVGIYGMFFLLISRNQLELYRGVLIGSRQLNCLAAVVFSSALLRIIFLIGLIHFSSLTLFSFFAISAIFNLIELLIFRARFFGISRAASDSVDVVGWGALPWRFSLQMAFASMLWLGFSQSDKLYLSRMLPIDDFASFGVATLLAGGIFIVIAPVQNIVSNRLAHLLVLGDRQSLRVFYGRATHWIGLLVWPFCAVLIFFAESVIWVWCDDPAIARHSASTLIGYAFGNALIAMGGVGFYLQFTLGRLHWHIWGALIFMLALLVMLHVVVDAYGLSGVGWTWVGVNILYFFTWLPLVYRRVLHLSYFSWLIRDVLPVAMATIFTAAVLSVFPVSIERPIALLELMVAYILCLFVACMVVPSVRDDMRVLLSKLLTLIQRG